MQVGDYVRTKRGQIHKITDLKTYYENGKLIEDKQLVHIDNYFSGWDLGQFKELISKSSPNIIDLIEEHDILKVEEQKGVYTICEVEVFREPYENYDFLGVRIDNRPIARRLYEFNIKSIVTKEQFEAMEYKVGVDKK